MCGIVGIVRYDRPAAASHADVLAMRARLAHRGPDGEGFWSEPGVGLVHRRLAIIDLAGGGQPLGNEDGSVQVVFNGEIYNFQELRAELEGKGHRFRTRSDTEVLVHLYEEHGPGFARHLNGMFALAIWDSRRRRLVLARDRMGQKPLFYSETSDGGLVFGSEPKALLAHPNVPRRLDPRGLSRYLFYEYIPAPHSIWSGMKKLPPAHVLVWEGGASTVRRYWTPPAPVAEAEAPPLDVAASRFWDEFRSAVARHRRSDVPLGVFLSGGVDSSAVANLAQKVAGDRVNTFTLNFDEAEFSEGRIAREVAEAVESGLVGIHRGSRRQVEHDAVEATVRRRFVGARRPSISSAVSRSA